MRNSKVLRTPLRSRAAKTAGGHWLVFALLSWLTANSYWLTPAFSQAVNSQSSIQVGTAAPPPPPSASVDEIEEYYSGNVADGQIGKTGDAITYQAYDFDGESTISSVFLGGLASYSSIFDSGPDQLTPPGILFINSGSGFGGMVVAAIPEGGISSGAGYSPGDILTLDRNLIICGFVAGIPATVSVDAVDGGGGVTAVTVINRGTNYERGCTQDASGGAGGGARITTSSVLRGVAGGVLFRPWDINDDPVGDSLHFGFGRAFFPLQGSFRRRWRVLPGKRMFDDATLSSFAFGIAPELPPPNIPLSLGLSLAAANDQMSNGMLFQDVASFYTSPSDGGAITSVTISTPGAGYSVNDILTISPIDTVTGTTLNGQNGQLRVVTIGGGGSVTSVTVETGGSHWFASNPLNVTGGTGAGFQLTVDTFEINWQFISNQIDSTYYNEFYFLMIPGGAQPGVGSQGYLDVEISTLGGVISNTQLFSSGGGGSGYAPGDTGTLGSDIFFPSYPGFDGTAAYVVDTVDGLGGILTYHLTSFGNGYQGSATDLGVNAHPTGGADWFTLELGRTDGDGFLYGRIYDSTGAPLMAQFTSIYTTVGDPLRQSFFEMTGFVCFAGNELSSTGPQFVIDKTETRFTDQNRDP